jgi:hypothetical protein
MSQKYRRARLEVGLTPGTIEIKRVLWITFRDLTEACGHSRAAKLSWVESGERISDRRIDTLHLIRQCCGFSQQLADASGEFYRRSGDVEVVKRNEVVLPTYCVVMGEAVWGGGGGGAGPAPKWEQGQWGDIMSVGMLSAEIVGTLRRLFAPVAQR